MMYMLARKRQVCCANLLTSSDGYRNIGSAELWRSRSTDGMLSHTVSLSTHPYGRRRVLSMNSHTPSSHVTNNEWELPRCGLSVVLPNPSPRQGLQTYMQVQYEPNDRPLTNVQCLHLEVV